MEPKLSRTGRPMGPVLPLGPSWPLGPCGPVAPGWPLFPGCPCTVYIHKAIQHKIYGMQPAW